VVVARATRAWVLWAIVGSPMPQRRALLMGRMNRRQFVQQGALGAVAAGLSLGGTGTAFGAETAAPRVVKRGDMVYRRLGRTGLMVSELAVGGSPNPEPAIFTEALDRGLSFVDSSGVYPGSEENIGAVLEGRRDQVTICTKTHFPPTDAKQSVIAACERALEKLKTDHIDVWCIHGITKPEQFLHDEVQAAFEQLRRQGKIRFFGVSCHSPLTALPPIIATGKLDVALIPFNVFSGSTVRKEDVDAGKVYENWLADSGLGAVLDLAKTNDVGIVAMKTMSGGARQKLDSYQADGATLAQSKLKWVLSHEAVASALSEVLNYKILDENLGAVGKTLKPEEQALLRDHVREASTRVCRMCGSCERACPAKLPIRDVLRYVVYHDLHGKPERARSAYQARTASGALPRCGDCSACRQACPHGLDVPGQLLRAREVLA